MKSNFDNIAPFYDRLSRLVFGDAILKSQVFLIDAIPANSSVLIVGGGTGQILEEIAKKNTHGLKVTYVDISKKMIALAKKKEVFGNQVIFINQSIFNVSFQQPFDVVITPFFFDNFSNHTAKVIFDKIDAALKPTGLWSFADFQITPKNNLWQKFLLKIMYIFFKMMCDIEASDLPDITALFKEKKYQTLVYQTFYRNFIYSVIYVKTE